MILLTWLVGCAGGGSAESGDSAPDTGEHETAEGGPMFLLIADDPEAEVPAAWGAWFESLGRGEVRLVAADAEERFDVGQLLTVLLPDLGRSSKNSVLEWTAQESNVLAMGVGGARAYDGLGLGIGYSDGGQGAVDGLSVNEGFEADPVFAGVDLSDGPVVDVWQVPVTDVGIVPGADGLVVLGWDDRYPGSYADLCHVGRYWAWGWGDTDGTPDQLTADGALVWSNLVNTLAPE